jgi:uncharacterized protein
MPRSRPSRPRPAGTSPAAGTPEAPDPPGNLPTPRRKLSLRVASLMRWMHIYLSMSGMAALLFFSATGITLNHPDWFYGRREKSIQAHDRMEVRWLDRDPPGKGPVVDDDPAARVDKLEVVEHLRKAHGLRGALAEFRVDDRECVVTFKGPGYAADAFIDRSTGHYDLTETSHGLVSVLNDLHKGRDTGKAWSLVIDVSAVLITLVAITGIILLFYIKRRRVSGLATAVVGTVVLAAIVWLFVP